jgi:hypothetical protein
MPRFALLFLILPQRSAYARDRSSRSGACYERCDPLRWEVRGGEGVLWRSQLRRELAGNEGVP